eukprot:1287687-Rhodomonas_salina.1
MLAMGHVVACAVCFTTRTRSALASLSPAAPTNSVSTPTTLWSAGAFEAETLTAPSSPYWSSCSSPGSMGVNCSCPTKRPSSLVGRDPFFVLALRFDVLDRVLARRQHQLRLVPRMHALCDLQR